MPNGQHELPETPPDDETIIDLQEGKLIRTGEGTEEDLPTRTDHKHRKDN